MASLKMVSGSGYDSGMAPRSSATFRAMEEVLMAEFNVGRGQLDALWAYVGNKGEKTLSRD